MCARSSKRLRTIKSINVITAWDKSGISPEDCDFYDDESNKILEDEFDSEKAVTYINKIGEKITGYGSVKKGLLNSYQKFTRYEKCWPTTNNEKSLYIPTKMFNFFNSGYNATDGTVSISGDYTDQCVNDILSNPNPCIPFENVSVPWKPTLLVGVFLTSYDSTNHNITQYGTCQPVIFNAEFTIPCTFKGLKGDK